MLFKKLASSNCRRSGVSRVNAEIKASIKLSGVCRHWRRVILNDGTLWANVPADTARPWCAKLLQCILERSKQTNVSVTASAFLSTTNQAMMKEVMKIILEGSNHMGGLVLDIDSTLFLEEWTSPAPALRKLRINNRGPCTSLTTCLADKSHS